MQSRRWCYQWVEANPVDTSNKSEHWENFKVGIVPLQDCATLEPTGNKLTQSPPKKGKV